MKAQRQAGGGPDHSAKLSRRWTKTVASGPRPHSWGLHGDRTNDDSKAQACSSQGLLDVVLHGLLLGLRQGIVLPLGRSRPGKEVNGAIVGMMGRQRCGLRLAEYLVVMAIQGNPFQVRSHVSGRACPGWVVPFLAGEATGRVPPSDDPGLPLNVKTVASKPRETLDREQARLV